MQALEIAVGVAFIPMILFGVGLIAMVDAGKRSQAARHPIRALSDALSSDNE